MSQTYRVAFIGCGKRARAHLPGIRADARCQLVAACDVVEANAAALLEQAAVDASVYTDHLEMLSKERPDVVITPLWTGLHLPVFRDCVQAGAKAVLCEKPMAPTWADCREMARLAEERRCLLTFCHQRRFAAGNLLARRLLAAGVFGQVERMDLYSPKGLLDCGTHSIDQALSFNDEQPAKWVLAAMDTSTFNTPFGIHAETHLNGTIVFANDVRAHVWCGGPDQDLFTGVRVIGSEGFFEIEWAGQFNRAVVYRQPDWQLPELTDQPPSEMCGVISNAIDCLRSGDEPELSYHKTLRNNEIIFAMFESVRQRRRIELPIVIDDHPLEAMIASGTIPISE